ncbi:MAG: ATP-grasp domain-containing protein [Gorillibacterium sp.]|nr:ATP-grasp domain-containing protein [Gorillibacterium sp.]
MSHSKTNILFTSSGRRVSLVKKFREAYTSHGLSGKIITADLKSTAPTAFFADRHYLVPRLSDEGYLPTLIHICQQENIQLLIPLIDSELLLLAQNRHLFDQMGVKLLLSSKELNEISCDKKQTYHFFVEHGISTPRVYSEKDLAEGDYIFPLIIKPTNGSSSKGVTKIRNEQELRFFLEYTPFAMAQELVCGDEYTVDVMTDFAGRIKTIVPRLRIETRAGEVSKGKTVKDKSIIQAVEAVVGALPGPVGCLTLQCFKQEDGQITFIEINPRFGGGIPLSIEAGADFPFWSLQLANGESLGKPDFNWTDQLTMLRYDEAIFTRGESNGSDDDCF